MTDDRLNMMKAYLETCIAKDSQFIGNPRDVLDLIKMIEDARAEIDRLHEEIEGLKK